MPAAQPMTAVAAKAVATNPGASVPATKPIMSLTIPAAWSATSGAAGDAAPQLSVLAPLSPLSPIAFGFPGPRELRKRREDELDRCMKDLGFVEAPSPISRSATAASDSPASESESKARSSAHARAFSASCVEESDEERDVVLLVDEHTDEELEPETEEEHPTRSESRAAMLTLFADIDTAPSPIAPHPPVEPAVDVQVEIVSKKAAARTRRRFSRKWVREQSGKRWTEKDFSEILCQLRKLR
ncbi:hypothetical protein TRAPUB_10917 [Trametes pubescens]|uniref:Uncharacterized protein n=1 Tax=Trametes pubescens TaxID=154538 RepID=A0A1M2VYA3_TRAPU|nr:hypothetical protein TRAPUB_10917 [Trametes pubescens]